MQGYKEPSFQDRVASAQRAKGAALEKLRSRPPLDPAELARRAARQAAKEAEAEARRAARREVKKAAEAAAQAALIAAQEATEAAIVAAQEAQLLDEAERKAARDARYAARKKK